MSHRSAVPRASLLQKAATACLLGFIVLAALLAGLRLRYLAWQTTEHARYTGDINNAFYQGSAALREGFLDAYANAYDRGLQSGWFNLDYAPARLAVMTLWARDVRLRVDGRPADWRIVPDWPVGFYERARQLHRTYDLCRPLLWFNASLELAAAAGAVALVRRWTAPRHGPTRALWLGVLAGVWFWFNPALIWDAHVWPQWDSWLLPFFLWALVAASDGWWFSAGVLVAVAAMFKAQVLLGAPLLLLWPLSRGQLGAAARWGCGLIAGVAASGAPWLVRVDHAVCWAAVGWAVGVAAAVVLLRALDRRQPRWFLSAGGLAALVLLCWPLWRMGWMWIAGGVIATALLALAVRCRPRGARLLGAAAVSAALLLCPAVWGGGIAWLDVGILHGGQANLGMSAGANANLPALLESHYGWSAMDPAFTLPAGRWSDAIGAILHTLDWHDAYQPARAVGVPIRHVLIGSYLLLLIVCSVAAAKYAAAGSPRFLLAAATPWVLLYALLPQMHERYLLWGACMGSLTIALSPGWGLLNLFLSVVSLSSMTAWVGDSAFHRLPIIRFFSGWIPGVGWAVLLAAAVMLYGTLAPRRMGSNRGR